MKRFHFFLAALMTLGVFGAAMAAMPLEKKEVKFEVSSVEHAVSPALISSEFNFHYVAEANGESIIEKPPAVIWEIADAYKTSTIKPPIKNRKDFLPEIRRLSCNSLAAASGRHV